MGFLEALLVGSTQFPQKAGELSAGRGEGETEGKRMDYFRAGGWSVGVKKDRGLPAENEAALGPSLPFTTLGGPRLPPGL